MGGKRPGTGDVHVTSRYAGLNRRTRRIMQGQLPRGDVLMFEDEFRKAFPNATMSKFAPDGRPVGGKLSDNRAQLEQNQVAYTVLESDQQFEETLKAQAIEMYTFLRKHGMIADKLTKVGSIAIDHWPVAGAKVSAACDRKKMDDCFNVVLTKQMWLDAIYDILAMHQSDGEESCVYLYANMVENDWDEGDTESLKHIYCQLYIVLTVVASRKYAEVKIDKYEREAAAAKRKADNVKNSVKVDKLRGQLDAERARNRDTIEQLKATVADMERRQQAEAERHSQQMSALECELAVYRAIEEQGEEVDNVLSDDIELLELPEDGVMFVGGHPNLLSKLKPLHRGWRFVSTVGEVPESVTSDLVFYYSRHVSHKVLYKLQKSYGGPLLYCDGTNLERLYDSMRRVMTARAMSEGTYRKIHV